MVKPEDAMALQREIQVAPSLELRQTSLKFVILLYWKVTALNFQKLLGFYKKNRENFKKYHSHYFSNPKLRIGT